MDGFAEVVSDMEYELAKKVGYSNERIIYNGPCKGPLSDEHLLKGGVTNIDSYDEALHVVWLAKEHINTQLRVAIRVNSDVGANYSSRFGIQIGTELFEKVINMFKTVDNISLVGLHCHVSRARSLESWQKRINNMLNIADQYIENVPDFIDLGSGMFGDMSEFLKKQFGDNVPSYEDYAEVVAGTMATHYSKSDKKPLLLTEPGTTLIAKYFSLITKVEQIKYIDDKCFATVDSSYDNVGSICHMKVLPYSIFRMSSHNETSMKAVDADIMGYTCLEQDKIYSSFPEDLYVGDIIEIENVGGYSIVSKPPFIRPNCPVYAVSGSEIIEIKRKETFEDVFSSFVL